MNKLDEIALRVAGVNMRNKNSSEELIGYARALLADPELLAELSKDAEPVATRWHDLKTDADVFDAVVEAGYNAARADLEATIAEKDAEIEASVFFEKQSSTLVNELRQQLAAHQAYAEQLREAIRGYCEFHDIETDAFNAVLSIPNDTTALREYCARVVEKVATMTLSTYALKTIAALIREGTFDAT